MSRIPGPGETFGRYQLERELGQGGMGVVHAALDTVLGRRVALKIVAPHLARDEEFRTRFAREAATQARLDSPHVVRIYDHGEHDGILFISTQLVDGVDLASLVAARGALDPALAVGVTEQLLAGLADAHRAQVVHRDVKPANVLVTEHGAAYLCDFGIATMAGQGLTRTGQVIGSLPWMAPERHYGQDAGAAGDLYSAGCLLWFALTGAAPFVGSDGEVMRGHLDGEVPQLVGTTPFARKVNAVLIRALAKEPSQRYASAEAMAADLRELGSLAPAAVVAAEAAPTTLRSAATRPATGAGAASNAARGRRPWAIPALVGASLLAAVAGGLGVRTLTSDDAALVAGARTVEVGGRTVTMQPTPTLSPVRSRSATVRASRSSVAKAADRVLVPDALASRASSTRPSSGARATAAAPAPRFRCWDNRTVIEYADCTVPAGGDGVGWVYAAYGSGCAANTSTSPLVTEVWQCTFGGGKFNVYHFPSVSAARDYMPQRMSTSGVSWQQWSPRGEAAGQQSYGRQSGRYRFVSYYATASGGTWGYMVDAGSAGDLDSGVGMVASATRRAANLRGVPL